MAPEQQWPGESVWTVVVGGGTGRRFGGPKQYERLGRYRVIDASRAMADRVSDGVIVVVPPDDVAAEGGVAGGATRTESVRNGLAAVPASATIVCVHDAARPFASIELYRSVVDPVAAGADAAVPGVAVTDTIKVISVADPAAVASGDPAAAASADPAAAASGGASGGTVGVVRRVVDTPSRDTLVAVQTPQAFRATVLRAAHEQARVHGHEATDDAALVERSGGVVVVVAGEPDNRKITHPDDLAWARRRVEADPS